MEQAVDIKRTGEETLKRIIALRDKLHIELDSLDPNRILDASRELDEEITRYYMGLQAMSYKRTLD